MAMIRQEFYVEHYWKVVVFWNIDYSLFNVIREDLRSLGMSRAETGKLREELENGKAKAVTCSSIEEHISIVLFNRHDSKRDYMNSIAHEAEHVKQATLEAYDVEDRGEAPAYTLGYLIGKMYYVFKELICSL